MQARKIAPFAVAGVILGAAALALTRSGRSAAGSPGAAAASSESFGEPDPATAQGAPAAPLASHAIMGSENAEAPGVTWTVPTDWEAERNPNGMRLATYRVRGAAAGEGAADISVARAGGSVDANIQRWMGQFDADPTERRDDKTVHGLPVTVAEIGGTYRGGMMPGAPANPQPDWTLLAAIVSPPSGAPYFFKVLGPSQAVKDARASFDALIASLTPDTKPGAFK